MLSAEELVYCQQVVEESFPTAVTKRRWTQSTDDYGDPVRDAETDTATTGRLIQRTSVEQTESGQVETTEWSLLVPHDDDWTVEDQAIVSDTTYEVLSVVHQPTPGESTHQRLELRVVNG